MIIGNDSTGGRKVYDVTKYLDDHPGGSEVVMEHAGKDADEMFEDIGHSSEARNIMAGFLIGTLKETEEDKAKKAQAAKKSAAKAVESKGGLNPMAVVAILIAIVVGVYFSVLKK